MLPFNNGHWPTTDNLNLYDIIATEPMLMLLYALYVGVSLAYGWATYSLSREREESSSDCVIALTPANHNPPANVSHRAFF